MSDHSEPHASEPIGALAERERGVGAAQRLDQMGVEVVELLLGLVGHHVDPGGRRVPDAAETGPARHLHQVQRVVLRHQSHERLLVVDRRQ